MRSVGHSLIEMIHYSPPGVTPNFVNPPSIIALTDIGPGVVFPIVTIFVLLRLYTKRFINRTGLGAEDCGSPDLVNQWQGLFSDSPST